MGSVQSGMMRKKQSKLVNGKFKPQYEDMGNACASRGTIYTKHSNKLSCKLINKKYT